MAVEFLIEKLKQAVNHHGHLFSGAEHEVEKLDNHLRRFKALPKQSRGNGEQLKEPVRRIRDVVYAAEDAIDAYVSQENPSREPPDIAGIVGEVEAALGNIGCFYGGEPSTADFAAAEVEEGGAGDNEDYPKKQYKHNKIVGMHDEQYKLAMHLTEKATELEVICIIGMAGLGKTVLAQKIFHDSDIVFEFPIRIWVYVSQVFTLKEIFLHILKYFTLLTDDINSKTDKELAHLVVHFLENEKFLLVIDDLWSPDDWDKLKVALPMSNKMGRVLITSRIVEVGRHVNRHKDPHMMRFLTLDESSDLLQLEVTGIYEYPRGLEVYGKQIAEKCSGHPLAIVLIGGILVKEYSRDTIKMKIAWQNVLESLKNTTSFECDKRLEIIIAMSYEKLPYHLRECFLYFGMFPEDFEIPVWKLIRLWIAEGFIQQNLDVDLEKFAENYFQELIERKLVRGVTFKLDGKVKTCRVHDLILDFCIVEAARDGLFQQIKMSYDGDFEPSVHEELKFRRLCINSNVLTFVSRKPNGPSVRSFVCSSREEMDMPMNDLSTIPKGFKLLRVLDVEPINFNRKLPRDLFQLLHLRYLYLYVKFGVLPLAFSQLLNMQTLVFNTSTRTLEIRADILNLTQLRHFKTKASATLPETSTSSLTTGENIQTFVAISPESCTKDVFGRARNLKKLGIRGNLALLLDGKSESFDSLEKLENLEKLKLLNDVYPIPPSGLPILSLPPPDNFPPKLKILTLSRTCLDWCHMSTIELLPNLEVLKLEDKAFVGDTWEVSDGGFYRLEVLRIERLNLKIWFASKYQFPKLKHLQLRHCDYLEQVPIMLVYVPSFLKLELFHCKRAVASARKIETKIKQEKYRQHEACEFSLSISPL